MQAFATTPDSPAHHRPRFHIHPGTGFLNDPNGPVIVDGVAHLYFQYRAPIGHPGAHVLWGHATSDDLVRWTVHRPAMAPHPFLGDREGCWSGNTVVRDDGAVVAFYSGYRSDRAYQSAQVAVSTDGGFSFGDPEQLPLDPLPEEGVLQLRDPFVWREEGSWWMVLGAGDQRGVGSARLHRSDDLATWTYLRPLAAARRGSIPGVDTGVMWECPQVLRVDGEDVLLIGSWTDGVTIGEVLSIRGLASGDLVVRRMDAGPEVFAPSVLREGPEGPVVWAWIREGRADAAAEAAGWSGIVSLPRTLLTGADGSMLSAPLPAMDALRQEELSPDDGFGAQLEALVRLPDEVLSASVTLRFGAEERLTIDIDAVVGEVRIDRGAASAAAGSHGGVTVIEDAFADDAEVRLFLDGSVLEAFTSGGRVATLRLYPTTPPPWRLEHDGGAAIRLWSLAG